MTKFNTISACLSEHIKNMFEDCTIKQNDYEMFAKVQKNNKTFTIVLERNISVYDYIELTINDHSCMSFRPISIDFSTTSATATILYKAFRYFIDAYFYNIVDNKL